MSFEIDRDPEKEPALWEMADKALRILSKAENNEKGFFLLIGKLLIKFSKKKKKKKKKVFIYKMY